jgi:MFS family permease
MSATDRMTALELRSAIALAAMYFLRMLGLFMVLPVLGLYVDKLPGATPTLIGLAIGLYGLTQASLQIPFGTWSDRIGRKPVITLGLVIFTVGGLVAAAAHHILTIVIGRALQGAGAVSGATLALAADLTRPAQRTKSMAIIGISIGAAFSLAFICGPIIDAHYGLRGVFVVSALTGIGALCLLWLVVPHAPERLPVTVVRGDSKNPQLRSLYFGVLCLHLVLAASFVSIPGVLLHDLGLPKVEHYKVYIPALVISLILIGPLLGRSHRSGMVTGLFPAAIGCLAAAEGLLWLGPSDTWFVTTSLTIFFMGFNFLEASLPSLISRAAPTSGKGAALGTYSTGQFVGTFIGGVTGGTAATHFGAHGVFAVAGGLAVLWLLVAWRTAVPVVEQEDPISS